MARILVMGATGLMGHALFAAWKGQAGCEILGTYHTQPRPGLAPLDICNPSAAKAMVDEFKPRAIVLLAAIPGVDYCEQHPEETRALNVEGSLNIVRLARETGATLIFFSSDYVFDGVEQPYAEDTTPRPLNEYGRQKATVERAILASLTDFLIVRVTALYGWELKGKNFVAQVIRAIEADRPMPLPTDQFYQPTYVENAAAVIQELVTRDVRGIVHVAGCDHVSRYTFGLVIAEVFGLDRALIVPALLKDLSPVTPRPHRTGLLTDKVRTLVPTPLWGIREGLGHMKQTAEAWSRQASASGGPAPRR